EVWPKVWVTLGAAGRAGGVVRLDYAGGRMPAGGGGEAPFGPPRRVEPYRLVTAVRRWYLVAFDLDRADWRLFRVDWMAPRSGTGPRFTRREVPGGDVAAFVAARPCEPAPAACGEGVR